MLKELFYYRKISMKTQQKIEKFDGMYRKNCFLDSKSILGSFFSLEQVY